MIPCFHRPVRDRGLPSPDVQEKATKLGTEMRDTTPEMMTERMKSDIAKWAAVLDKAGIAKRD
jgi:tripartite-type tricarboxylate transporter receptor subunit TctC